MPLVSVDALPTGNVKSLRELYGEPRGMFFRGRDGITCFHLEEPHKMFSQGGRRCRVAVLTHGIGTNSRIYDAMSDALVSGGFRVLRYDYLAHGWSWAAEGARWDREALQTQLDELLEHVLKPGEPVDLFVGHSTGGLLGPLAASTGKHKIRQLALISPAFWKYSPLIVKLADRLPSVARFVAGIKALKIAESEYLKNADDSFAREGGKYLFEEEYTREKENIKRMFQLHPQIVTGITGILTDFLRGDLQEAVLPEFKALVAGQKIERIGLFWGSHDVCVPVSNAQEVLSWPGAKRCVSFVELTNMGHDSPIEDPRRVAVEIFKFAGPPASAL